MADLPKRAFAAARAVPRQRLAAKDAQIVTRGDTRRRGGGIAHAQYEADFLLALIAGYADHARFGNGLAAAGRRNDALSLRGSMQPRRQHCGKQRCSGE